MSFFQSISWPDLRGLFEIGLLSVAIYYLLLFFRGTRGAQVLSGLVLVVAALLGLTYLFSLDTLTWIIQRFSVYLAIAFLIIFQPEIRKVLAEVGRQQHRGGEEGRGMIDALTRGVFSLADGKIGALIAIERQVGIAAVEQGGVRMDAIVSNDLLQSIFHPESPLHDGGVVIRGDRILAAGCVFPLSQKDGLSRQLGTRHRAAIGVSEETDALVIAVSEETGTVSLAYRGKLRRGLDPLRMQRLLESVLARRSIPVVERQGILRWLYAFRLALRPSSPTAVRGEVNPDG